MDRPPLRVAGGATWAHVSRALRAVTGFAQEDLAAELQVSRKTVQRWERGLGAPDDRAEVRLIELFNDQRILARGVDIGVANIDDLRSVLSGARRGRAPRKAVSVADGSVSGLIGRSRDLADLQRLIASSRLVTITGPGGVGKTSLAMACVAAADNTFDTLTIELVELRDAALILAGIAERLGTEELGARSTRDSVVRGIADRSLLLLLDNLEHLPQAAPIIDDLLRSCPQLRILATSRSPLRLADEVECRLQPLDTSGTSSAGTELFVRRARLWDRSQEFAEAEMGLITDVCTRLDGLPFAIELAAARLRAVPLRDLHARILDASNVLGRGPRNRPAHQQTLTDSIRWSFDLLSPEQQAMLVQLGYFVGGSTLAATELAETTSALEDVVALVEAGLVSLRADRYRMLETVRDFASSLRSATTDARFLHWAVKYSEQQARRLRGPEQAAGLDQVANEYPNLRAAVQQALAAGDGANAHRLATALCGYWDGRSLLGEARRWLELTIATDGADEVQRATVHTWLGYFSAHQSDMKSAAAHAESALRTWTELAIDGGIGYARLILGRVATEGGRYGEAETNLLESLRCLRLAGDSWGFIRPLNALGENAYALGRLDEARLRHEEALGMCIALDELGSQPSILCDIAHVAIDLGDIAAAGDAAERALAIASQLGNQVGVAHSLNALACHQFALGHAAAAVELWAEAEAIHDELGLAVELRIAGAISRDRATALSILGADRFRYHNDIGAANVPAQRSP